MAVFRLVFVFVSLMFLLSTCEVEQVGSSQDLDLYQYVDPFIGTGSHGHTFPGAVVPHGMVQLSPDTRLHGWESCAGYHYSDSIIYGFSHTHLSGTGIGDLGDILLLPYSGSIKEKPVGKYRKEREEALPGYYRVGFDNHQVEVELTTTTRVGMHRYSFEEGEEQSVMLDVGHLLQPKWGHSNVSNQLEIVNDSTLRGTKVSRGWAYDQQVHFYVQFSKPFTVGEVLVDEEVLRGQLFDGAAIRAYLDFGITEVNQPLLAKVGLSMVDTEGAKKNMDVELDHWQFDQVRQEARAAWNDRLNAIKIETKNEDDKEIFYTAMYHSQIAPMIYQDVDGRYRGMDKSIHKSKSGQRNYSVFSLWDTFRALHPLMTILDAKEVALWANSLIQKYEDGGMLPKWPLASNYTGTMVGYPAASVLADAVAKGIEGIDPYKCLEATLVSASYDTTLLDAMIELRKWRLMPEHNKYINEGKHIPGDIINYSVTYGLENAYYDWCISELARAVGEDSIHRVYAERGQNYRQYFDAETGFMRGKTESGEWREPFDPRYSDHVHADYVEGNAWQWTWSVFHDIEGFIDLFGSNRAFTTKLDSLFGTSSEIIGEKASADLTGLIGQYAHGNEPSHHIAYFYTMAGEPHKTQEIVDYILHDFYTSEPDGIIGNEDCGQMSAWYILSAMGFYQVCPGDPTYYIGRPLFDGVELSLSNGKTLHIDIENNSPSNKYVVKALLNGRLLKDLSFTHEELLEGGRMQIVMSAEHTR